MTAIITKDFRKENIRRLIEEIDVDVGNVPYYLAFGKSDPWTDEEIPDQPHTGDRQLDEVKRDFIGMKKIRYDIGADTIDAGFMVPSVRYQEGVVFKQWDPSDPLCLYPTLNGGLTTEYPCYAISANKIYICVKRGVGNTSGTISGLTTYGTVDAGDYTWAYVCDILGNSRIDIAEFKEVRDPTGSPDTSATAAKMYAAKVTSGGSGYTAATATILGDGAGATATVTVAGNQVTEVVITNPGSGYTIASIEISGDGAGAEAIPLLTPEDGFGASPIKDLPAWFAGIAVDYETSEGGELPVDISYRTVAIVREPLFNDPNSDGNVTTPTDDTVVVDCMKFLEIDNADEGNIPGSLVGTVIEQASTGAKAYANWYDTTANKLFYHQNNTSSVNGIAFDNGDITIDGSPTIGVTGGGDSEYAHGTGEVEFIEHRKAIERNAAQIESFKVIIQF